MTRRATRRRRGQKAKCSTCRFDIEWFTLRGSWRAFDPAQIDGHHHPGQAYPVEGKRAWTFPQFVEELMGREHLGRDDAEHEVRNRPWRVLHACPPSIGQQNKNRKELSR